jgi:DNA-binding NarL/FixJ family response regulator
MVAVTVSPAEALALVTERHGESTLLEPLDQEILRCIREGQPLSSVARAVGLSLRQLHRRLAVLRKRFDVTSTTALVARLSAHSGGTHAPQNVTGMSPPIDE